MEDILLVHGDIIFFDWKDKHDGHSDHVGIVQKVENGRVYTIEGNSSDSCRQRDYDINSFDVITCNPPYFKCNELSKKNLSIAKMNARHEVSINLSDIISISKKLLKNKGKINLIHRCDRLVEVINLLKMNGIEPKKIQFIYNNQNSSAKLFLIQGIKNGREGLIVSDPIILYNNDGTMNDKYKLILEEVQ